SLPALSSDAWNNSGLRASNDGRITFGSGTYQLGRVDVNVTAGGTIGAGTLWLLPGSSLSGDGTLNANVINSAQVNPGKNNSAGSLTLPGSYIQAPAGVLNIDIGGTSADQFDVLAVTKGV